MRGVLPMVLRYRSSGANEERPLWRLLQIISMLMMLAIMVFCLLKASTFYDAPMEHRCVVRSLWY